MPKQCYFYVDYNLFHNFCLSSRNQVGFNLPSSADGMTDVIYTITAINDTDTLTKMVTVEARVQLQETNYASFLQIKIIFS